MRAVNLLPRQVTADEKLGLDRGIVVGIAFTVLVAAILAGGFFLEKANASRARQRLVVAQTEFARVQSQTPSAPAPARLQIPVVLSQREPWHVALRAALASRVAWDVLLRQLEFVVPDKVSLTTVTVGAAGSSASGTITLGGYAFSSADLATFLSTLSRVPKVSNVALVSSTTNSGSKVQNFQISAQMALPAPPVTAPSATETTTTTGG